MLLKILLITELIYHYAISQYALQYWVFFQKYFVYFLSCFIYAIDIICIIFTGAGPVFVRQNDEKLLANRGT